MEMRVTIAQNKKKLIGKQCSTTEHGRAEKNHAAGNRSIKPTQFAFVLTTRKSRNEHIDEQIRQDGENHGKTPQRSHFGNRRSATREETDQKHSNLSLKPIKPGVRSQAFDQPNNLMSVFRVFVRL